MRIFLRMTVLVALVLTGTSGLQAQLPPAAAEKIDSIVTNALADTGAPSASLALVKDNQIAYVKAYGQARLDPATPARPEMRYGIGSVSKQFLAASILMLEAEGKLALDDPVGRYLPDLTRAREVTIRELLSHTSGYQDYYPLDYVAPFMLVPVTPEGILDRWTKKPLDFDPGTEWQYSNTNYVVAAQILEKVTGAPLWAFLEGRIFRPLGMESPINLAGSSLTSSDAEGCTRFGLGMVRPVPPEARGWLYAAGELAMTAQDLALWDQGLLEGKVLKPASLAEMIRTVRLKNGAPTYYALGVFVSSDSGHPRLSHGGAVSGFVSQNTVWLGQGAAVAVLTNLDGSSAPGEITRGIGPLLLAENQDPQAAQKLAQAQEVFSELQAGKIDRTLLTSDADAYFTPQVLADAAASLGPLGAPKSFEQTSTGHRGGMTYRNFRISFPSGKTLDVETFAEPDGKLAEYLIQ